MLVDSVFHLLTLLIDSCWVCTQTNRAKSLGRPNYGIGRGLDFSRRVSKFCKEARNAGSDTQCVTFTESLDVDNMTRRQFVSSAALTLPAAAGLVACSSGADSAGYEALAAQTWQTDLPAGIAGVALSQELVRCATLAPSSHNTQCWKFAIEDQAITILPDFSRRCPVVDPDDHHLFVSLGCAAENLTQAALSQGLHAEAHFENLRDAIHFRLTPTAAKSSPLFKAMAARQCTRGDYDGRALTHEELTLLERAGTSSGVRMLLLTERADIERVLEHVVLGNTAQMADPAFIKELKAWIRFNGSDAVRRRDGLFSVSSGNPSIPTWLGDLAFRWFFTKQSENDKVARQIRSSAGMVIFVSQVPSGVTSSADDRARWVEVGRCYQRFALQATALGIRNAFLNQPVEVASVRTNFAAAIGLAGQRPDLVVRFGRGSTLPPSLRRPVQTVLVAPT